MSKKAKNLVNVVCKPQKFKFDPVDIDDSSFGFLNFFGRNFEDSLWKSRQLCLVSGNKPSF